MTAYHVVDEATGIEVLFEDGTIAEATLMGRDLGRDLAILATDLSELIPLEFADPSGIRAGDQIIKLGYALGEGGRAAATVGTVSAVREATRTSPKVIQTDSALNSGDSGGPLLTQTGQVAGVTVSKLVAESVEGVGFGVILDVEPDWLDKMIDGETVCQPTPSMISETSSRDYREGTWAWYTTMALEFDFFNYGNGWVVLFDPRRGSSTGGGTRNYPAMAGVFIFSASLSSEYGSARAYMDVWRDGFEEVPGTVVTYLIPPRLQCHPHLGFVYEAEVLWEEYRSNGSLILATRERWMTIQDGSLLYFLETFAWPDLFDDYEERTDTILYSFRFQQ